MNKREMKGLILELRRKEAWKKGFERVGISEHLPQHGS